VIVTVNGTNDVAVVFQRYGFGDRRYGAHDVRHAHRHRQRMPASRPFQPQAVSGTYGSFTLDASGNWNYALDNANATVQALGTGDTLTETFTVARRRRHDLDGDSHRQRHQRRGGGLQRYGFGDRRYGAHDVRHAHCH